jgi:protein transport protein SEC24
VMQQGIQGVTQQFSQMGMGGAAPQQQPQASAQGAMRLNPLMPVDISMQGQPFHVTDLDQPPPPIILPPNVSLIVHILDVTC